MSEETETSFKCIFEALNESGSDRQASKIKIYSKKEERKRKQKKIERN